MSELPHQSLSGYLLTWDNQSGAAQPEWRKLRSTITRPHLENTAKQWLVLEHSTPERWTEDAQIQSNDSYLYPFLLSLSRTSNHAVLVGASSELVDHFMTSARLNRLVNRPVVKVDHLVQNFTETPNDSYVLSNVFARVEGEGISLRTVAFWGTDLADAVLFRKIREELSPFRAEIRDLRQGHTVMSIGSRGEITFAYDGAASLKALLKAIEFLTNRQIIEWPAANHGDDYEEDHHS